MEPKFGVDFSPIRIHRDARAASLAKEIHARAFTVGRDVFFGAGEYRPDSRDGRRLIAHELTHTIQQGGAGAILRRAPAKDSTDDVCIPSRMPSRGEWLLDQQLNDIRNSGVMGQPRTIQKGNSGAAVRKLHNALHAMACSDPSLDFIPVRSVGDTFDDRTWAALKSFQSGRSDANGQPLTPDGVLGPATLSALDPLVGIAPVPPVPQASGCKYSGASVTGRGEEVVEQQHGREVLVLKNFDVGKACLKPEMERALIAFRKRNDELLATGRYSVRIEGEASTTGSEASNEKLGLQRARCTERALVDHGLDPSWITRVSSAGEMGARQRRSSAGLSRVDGVEDSEERRVRILLTASKAPPKPEPDRKSECPTEDWVCFKVERIFDYCHIRFMTDKLASDTVCQTFPSWSTGVGACTIAKLGRDISESLRKFDDFCCTTQPPSVEEELQAQLPVCVDRELEVVVKKDFPNCDWPPTKLAELREACIRRLLSGAQSEPEPVPES